MMSGRHPLHLRQAARPRSVSVQECRRAEKVPCRFAVALLPGCGRTHEGEIVIFAVVLESTEREWWSASREQLELQFRRKSVMVFLQDIEVL